MADLKDYIKEKRPSLGESSITTYSSVLKSLYKKVFGDEKMDFSKFNETEKIIDFLKDVASSKRKSILSALVVITDKKAYRDLMLDDIKTYNTQTATQEKTPTQEANWVEKDQIETLFNSVKADALLLMKKASLTPSDLQQIQNYIILALLSGLLIPPRRSKDYCDFKIKNVDEEKDNFLKKNTLVFNSYKTAKTYGKQEVEVPKELLKILKSWIKINPTEYLLFDSNMNKLSSVKLTQRLNKLFGKKIAINALRHSFLTEKYPKQIAQEKEQADTMADMGSSTSQLKGYIKRD